MLLPMIVIAGVCILFGVYNALPLNQLIQPILGAQPLGGHSFAGFPSNLWLVIITVIVLIGAILNHYYGVKRTGKGIGAVDHIHYAPVLHGLYDKAEKKYFDPYDIGMKIAEWFSLVLYWIDRFVDWVYEVFTVRIINAFTAILRWMHSGNFSNYVVWALVGAALVVFMVLR